MQVSSSGLRDCFRVFAAGWLVVLSVAAWAGPLPINTRLGGDFALPSTVAETSRLSDFKGKVVLLNFGYTSCPDICPMVLNRMAAVLNELEDARSKVQPLFITFDPERDTRERLQQYLKYFGADFVGFTGTGEQLAAVARQYGVIAIAQKSDSAAGTLYTHSDYIYLLDQQGRVRALFAKSDSIDKMVDDIESLLED
ncbi:MAG: SCO family protein [Ketobacter sp.]|nr:MAG: SCO family protein [Ketobacter sp.]